MNCRCTPPRNPLGYAHADPGQLWQCSVCDRYWRAAVTRDSVGEIVDDLAWTRIPRKQEAYYLGQDAA